jgi:hypothetical protein
MIIGESIYNPQKPKPGTSDTLKTERIQIKRGSSIQLQPRDDEILEKSSSIERI